MSDVAEPERPLAAKAAVEPWRLGRCDAEVLALRANVWGADHPHTRPDFLEWLFGDANPAGPGTGVVLRRAGRAVGFAGLCPRLARIDGRDVVIAHGLDYMVERGIGAAGSGRYALRVAADWAEVARKQEFAFGINFPNENSRRLLTSSRLGWREVLSPRLMVRPLHGRALGQGHAVARIGMAFGAAVLEAAARLRPGAAHGTVRPIHPSDAGDAAALDELWLRRRDDTPVSLVRDAAALRWRYELHPIRKYRLLGWEDAGRLATLLVTTRRELAGLPAVLIVDALVDRGFLAATRTLIAEALREAAADGACLAAAEAAPGTALHRALARAGFVAVPRRFDPKPFMLVALPFDAGTEVALSPEAWNFAWGDMDVV